MRKLNYTNWGKFGFEFLSIFIAVVSAFALNNWNENSKANKSENKILLEIRNGLQKDIVDIHANKKGHEQGNLACNYFRNILANQEVNQDSILIHYLNLTRDFISIQNTAGYETLKSKGLELINSDSLRLQIISLYEYDYNTLRKLEEEYYEMQYQANYFKDFNDNLAPHFKFDSLQRITGIHLPLNLPIDKNKILSLYLWKIQFNRQFILTVYVDIEKKIKEIQHHIDVEIES
ncbi:MAG: DUF6090 family protein [Ginsengibacter sp.]